VNLSAQSECFPTFELYFNDHQGSNANGGGQDSN